MGRFGFVAKRLLQTVPLLFGIMLVVFLLLQITPGDPARQVAGLRASEAQLARVRADLGLDDPVVVQYGRYVARVLQGDLGYSYKSRQPVAKMIGDRVGVTAWLLGAGTILTLLISVPLAIAAALHKDGLVDHAIRAVGVVGIGMPVFWTGMMLILFISLPTGWFPVGGFGETFAERVRSIFLPALTLAISSSTVLIRSLRASILSVLDSDYVAAGRSLGVSGARLIRRFVLRNAASSTVTLLALQIGFLLFGAVIIEATFALPGLGEGLVQAALGRDLPTVQGYTLLFAVIVVAVYLAADIVIAILDPRVEIR